MHQSCGLFPVWVICGKAHGEQMFSAVSQKPDIVLQDEEVSQRQTSLGFYDATHRVSWLRVGRP
jgi:hypothetical protein